MVMNPIPQFQFINNRLHVYNAGVIAGIALYEGNQLILEDYSCFNDFSLESLEPFILAIENINTGFIKMGAYHGGQLVIQPSYHPVSERHWRIIGRVVAVERVLDDAHVSQEQWYVASSGSETPIIDQQEHPLSPIYLSELAKCRSLNKLALLASTQPITIEDRQYFNDIPQGHIWFLLSDIEYHSTSSLPLNQRWAIHGRKQRFQDWKLSRKRMQTNVYPFPISLETEIISHGSEEGDKLASK
jgi:hypothetical protein